MKAALVIIFSVAALAGCKQGPKYSFEDYDADPQLARRVVLECNAMSKNESNADANCSTALQWSTQDRPGKNSQLPDIPKGRP